LSAAAPPFLPRPNRLFLLRPVFQLVDVLMSAAEEVGRALVLLLPPLPAWCWPHAL